MPRNTKTAASKAFQPLAAPDFILALDLSLAHTGYALTNLTTGNVIKGLIEPGNLKGMERLAFLRTRVLQLAATHPDTCLVLIEGYAYGAKGAAVVSLGELGGTIRLALWETRIPYLEIPPAQVKKFVTGKGNAPKQIMLKEVFKRFDGEDIDDDNIADAFSLMQLGLALVGRNAKPLVQFQEQVVADVAKAALKQDPPVAIEAAA